MVQRALGILVVGVIISVGGMIFMSVNMSANTTGQYDVPAHALSN